VGVSRFLAERGADVLVTDMLSAEALKDSVVQLADLEATGAVRYRLGEHNVSDFTTCDLVVVNPAVKPDNRFVRAARAAGIAVTSEIRLLVKHLPNRLKTIGVTGSAGKSTTTAMIGHVLRKVLRQGGMTPRRQDAKTPRRKLEGPGVWMGGNIGGSLLPFVDDVRDDDWVVLELSSFMLAGLRDDEWSPHIAVLTNISPNHLDWHGDLAAYRRAKQVIVAFQNTPGHRAFWGPGGPEAMGFEFKASHVACSGVTEQRTYELLLPGQHNQLNAQMALRVVHAVTGLGVDELASYLTDFTGLPHRLEYMGEVGGVKCYNDSKSTTPEASTLAIEGFDVGKVRIILGGYDKGSDFAGLAGHVAKVCAGVYTIGATGDAIADAVEAALPQETGRPETCGGVNWPAAQAQVVRCGMLDVAVERALADAKPGDVLVLSPGCASWDQFANYEVRGERFGALVKAASGKQV